ncbi:hypothetical protein QYF61_026794 [Mycteria americana]|uniref:Uncharacterized protein n=1 Tax=Mycteria americana TaxID=33587 RepID=A0AAN7SMI9_MYCAM|nr:hypothetical protein QYF61_026794 [Mycteria americana]
MSSQFLQENAVETTQDPGDPERTAANRSKFHSIFGVRSDTPRLALPPQQGSLPPPAEGAQAAEATQQPPPPPSQPRPGLTAPFPAPSGSHSGSDARAEAAAGPSPASSLRAVDSR